MGINICGFVETRSDLPISPDFGLPGWASTLDIHTLFGGDDKNYEIYDGLFGYWIGEPRDPFR